MDDIDCKNIYARVCSKAFLILLMIGNLFNIGGCVAIGHGTYSWPTFVGGSEADDGKEYPVLNLSGIAIRVVAHNDDSFGLIGPVVPFIPIWEHTGGSPFWIGVHLNPEIKEFVFDPFQVGLALEGGQLLLPERFTGPFMSTEDDPTRFCSGIFDPEFHKSEHATFFVIGEMCFGIAFNIITPKPDAKFSVLIDGLEQKERSVSVPKITFGKKERGGWSICLSGSVCTEHWTTR